MSFKSLWGKKKTHHVDVQNKEKRWGNVNLFDSKSKDPATNSSLNQYCV